MRTFAEVFKKYRLRAEFETFASFGNALAEKGYFYDESIFSHWQKGTRTPTERKLVLTIIGIFVTRKAIQTKEEADEFLSSTGLGYLTKNEIEKFDIKIKKSSRSLISRNNIIMGIILIMFLLLGFVYIL